MLPIRHARALLARVGLIRSKRAFVFALGLAFSLAPLPALAMPIISELFYDATGSDDGLSFVELWGAPGTVLDGLVLEGVNGSNGAVGPTITLSGVIPADGFFVVADLTSAGTTSVVGADLLANFDFQNGPDSVVLRDGSAVLDAVGYGVFSAGEVFAGEGSAAPDVSAGASLARVFSNLDTNDNAADFVALSAPTPGSGTLAAVPEPGSGALFALGISGLGVLGRRRARS